MNRRQRAEDRTPSRVVSDRVLALAAGLLLVACAPTPSPVASSAPSGKPVGAAATAPAGSTDAPSGAGAAAAWQVEWDNTVAAAKQEGTLALAGAPIPAAREALVAFEKAYPQIRVEYTGLVATDLASRLIAERAAGLYLWDVVVGGGIPASALKTPGLLDPFVPSLLLPEVLDDHVWLGGLKEAFYDEGRAHAFGFGAFHWYQVYVNRDVVPEAELSRVEDLVDPRWKGKIASTDLRTFGPGCAVGAHWLMASGEDSFRRLLANDPAQTQDRRQAAEWVVRERYPIMLGISQVDLAVLTREGLGLNVKPLAPDTDTGARISVGSGMVAVINQAPHPNAAKVFVNWLLSREGQSIWARNTNENSRRVDVTDGPPETRADPNRKYLPDIAKEENLGFFNRCLEIGKEVTR
jgi:iron(III) transport system substrate-binding protein